MAIVRYCVCLTLLLGVLLALAAPAHAARTTVGQFTFDLPAGWERASSAEETANAAWIFIQTAGVAPGAQPVVVAFSHESMPYKDEAERTAYLGHLHDNVRSTHPSGFRADWMRLAGVEAERLAFNSDGSTIFYLSPFNAEQVFLIVVESPGDAAHFPESPAALLSTLAIAGPAPAAVAGAPGVAPQPPPAELAATPAATPVADAAPAAPAEPALAQAPAAVSAFLTVTPDFQVTATGLADTDRAWGTGAAIDPVQPAAPGPALAMPALLDLRLLAEQQIGGGAAMALAALRELAGPLSPEDDARLTAKYAPFFIKPNAEATAYFDKLNPLLYEMLMLRAVAATAAAEFDAAWHEAGMAALYGNEEGERAALALADASRKKLEAVQVRLAEVAAEAARLGNPPDPIAAAAAARRTHTAAVETMRSVLPAPVAPTGGVWALVQLDIIDRPATRDNFQRILVEYVDWPSGLERSIRCAETYILPEPPSPLLSGFLPESKINIPRVTMSSTITYNSYEFQADYESEMNAALNEHVYHFAKWTAPPAVLKGGSEVLIQVEESQDYKAAIDELPVLVNNWHFAVVSDTLRSDHPELLGKTWQACEHHHQLPTTWVWNYLFYSRRGAGLEDRVKGGGAVPVPKGKREGQQMSLAIVIDHSLIYPRLIVGQKGLAPGMVRVYHYRWTSDAQVIAEAERIAAAAAAAPPTGTAQGDEPVAATAPGEEQAEAIAQRERIEFHQRSIAIIQRNLERDRAELARETDPARRADLEWRILNRKSDLIAEQDRIRTIETGQIVRSRTPFDDYAHDLFVRRIRENQLQIEQFQRASAALQRLAAMLPPDEAEHARRFIDRQVTRETMAELDIEQVRKVANALHLKVTGHVQRDRAKAAEADAWATYKLETAQSIKSAADAGMFVCSLFGGKPLVMLAYQATTGYVEGGPREAVLQSAIGLSTLVTGKLVKHGAGKAKQWVTQKKQLAEFQHGRAAGEQKVRDFLRAQGELERAAAGATPKQLQGLQAKVRSTAAVVHADPHAKNYLKFRGSDHAQRAYNAHMRSVHAETEARFHELMRQHGWNQPPLREFRNAASRDSVGMDYDIGLDKDAAKALRRHGKPASLHKWQRDAQDAWDDAYRQTTGQSARGSWETVTTSAHAEAYKDPTWLSGDISTVQRKWAQQAADVTRYKNWHILNDPAVAPMLRLQEASRGTAKDMQTKLLPLLAAARPASPQAAQALEKSKRHWTEVQSILAKFGRNEIDPIQASRRIREKTGGKDIPQVVDEAAQMIESLGRHVGR